MLGISPAFQHDYLHFKPLLKNRKKFYLHMSEYKQNIPLWLQILKKASFPTVRRDVHLFISVIFFCRFKWENIKMSEKRECKKIINSGDNIHQFVLKPNLKLLHMPHIIPRGLDAIKYLYKCPLRQKLLLWSHHPI